VVNLSGPPKHSEAVIYRVVDGEAILLNLDNGYYYSLNPLGSEVWAMCDGTHPLRSIVEQMCAEYDVAWDQAQRHVLELIHDLQREGLVTIHGLEAETRPAAR